MARPSARLWIPSPNITIQATLKQNLMKKKFVFPLLFSYFVYGIDTVSGFQEL
jgi:hypothetical protein